MFSNFGKAVGRGFNRIKSPASRAFGFLYKAYGYFGIVKLAKKLPGFAVNQKVLCQAQVPVLHKHQECKYVSSKCHKDGLTIDSDTKYLTYKGKRYPITPLVGNGGGEVFDVKGNRLFAINTAGENHYLDFESKLDKNTVLVVAYDGTKCVDPVMGKGNRKVLANFGCQVYPFSFSVIDHETKEVSFPVSLLMLPFNLSGLAIGFAGRLSAGLLSAVAKGLDWITKGLSDRLDKKIIHQQSGVLAGGSRNYFSTFLIFTLSTLSNFLSTASCFVKNSAELTEALVRFPCGLANGIYNYNMRCVPVQAGAAAVAKSCKSIFTDLRDSSSGFLQSFTLCKARLSNDVERLRDNNKSSFVSQEQIDEQLEQKEDKQDKKKGLSRSDLNTISEIGKDLREQVLYGTSKDISKEQSKQKKSASANRSL